MDPLGLLLWSSAALVGLSLVLLLIWAACYHWLSTEIPRDICQPSKLRILHFLIVFLFGIDYVLWKTGLLNQLVFVRAIVDLIEHPVFGDPKLTIKNVSIRGVPVRVYQPKAPQSLRRGIVHIHGGGGVIGSIACYERVSRYLANETDSVVFTVDYGVSPEHSYPLQFQQCHDVTAHVLQHAEEYGVDPARVMVCGDSFGGLLTAATCQSVGQRRDLPKLRAQILVYALVQMLKFNLPSYKQNDAIPILSKMQALRFALQYMQRHISFPDLLLEGSHVSSDLKTKYNKWLSPNNIPEEFRKRKAKVAAPTSPHGDVHKILEMATGPKLAPLFVDDEVIRQLPETFILTCQYDVFRDDGLLYKKRLEENGVPVSWCHLVDGFHGVVFLMNHWLFHFSSGKTGMDQLVDFIRRL
ncbi:arylacetamide deacetylase-like 4 [Paroedura picta]|uniref:arylacetamide deacetylase-like 4 n=1 Tax=Paroedura picta TaxID=143630 RepID=UPI0040563C5A